MHPLVILSRLAFVTMIGLSVSCTQSKPIGHGGHNQPISPSQPNSGSGAPSADAKLSRAYGLWSPALEGECPKSLHDQYWVYGPDGKVYPTWHPPTDTDPATGKTCTYGHEHGDDPRGSKLETTVSVPFGYVNELLSPNDPNWQRNEDHVGHKIFVGNDLPMTKDNKVAAHCNTVVKLHQGTHSHDAFTNNLHEMFFDTKCDDGTELHWKNLQAFGKGGHMLNGCSTKVFTLFPENDETPSGTAMPDIKTQNNKGSRVVPDRTCADSINNSDFQLWMMSETWVTNLERSAKRVDGKTMRIALNPYFEVGNPARFFDPTAPNRLGRLIDLCYGPKALAGFKCDGLRQLAPSGLAYNDTRSPFNGADRNLRFAGVTIDNEGGPTKWYSDAFGENLQLEPDPIKGITLEQFISGVENGKWTGSPNIPSKHDQHPGIHAPN